MESVVLVIHLFLALGIIALVLIQRSEGGGLGIGGGGGGVGNLASAQGTANFLTKLTTLFAFAFFGTSLFLGVLAGSHSPAKQSIMDALDETPAAETQTIPTELPDSAVEMPAEEDLEEPTAPIAE